MEIITHKISDGVLTIFFSGHIDSGNAAEAEKKVMEIQTANSSLPVVIDMENLQYISSAGLRILLRLKKGTANIKIINVAPEVYEVFDMTGFTEMMDISKAYRVLSVDGCEVIGQGANGMVYRLDPDTVIKVYLNADSLPDIQRERELARKAFVLGIPTAIPYDVVKVGNSYGSVFELLNAKSFAKILAAEPERFDEIANLNVDLLKKIHSTEVKPEDMPSIKATALGWANDLKGMIDDTVHTKLVKMIEEVPESNMMCHGDYHVKNVMIQNGEVLLIDMDTLCHGNPVFEFGSIFNAYVGFGELREGGATPFLGISDDVAKALWLKTVELYFDTTDKAKIQDYENKAKAVGYTRILRRVIRRTPDDTAAIEHYKKQLTASINAVENLLF